MVPASRSSVAVTEAAHAVFFTAGKMSRVADSPIIVAEMAMLDDMRRDKVLLRAKACGVGGKAWVAHLYEADPAIHPHFVFVTQLFV